MLILSRLEDFVACWGVVLEGLKLEDSCYFGQMSICQVPGEWRDKL
jgi:hypothetical protein